MNVRLQKLDILPNGVLKPKERSFNKGSVHRKKASSKTKKNNILEIINWFQASMNLSILSSIFLSLITFSFPGYCMCNGNFVNPVTDICWKCVFPLTILWE